MLTFTAPTPLVGRLLREQLAAAGLDTGVQLEEGRLVLLGLDEAQRSVAQSVVDAHSSTAQAELETGATARANETTIRDRATQALAANATFLAITSPTNAQVSAQVKALTRQNQALIRLLLQRFDGTD